MNAMPMPMERVNASENVQLHHPADMEHDETNHSSQATPPAVEQNRQPEQVPENDNDVIIPEPREWHNNLTDEIRYGVLHIIYALLCARSTRDDLTIYRALSQRLEILLYYQAFSLQEYTNENTLEQRIYALNIKSRVDRIKGEENRAYLLLNMPVKINSYRPFNSATYNFTEAIVTDFAWESNPLLFNGNLQVVEHIVSFLTLKEAILCGFTSKLAHNIIKGKAAHVCLSYPKHLQFDLASLAMYPNVEHICMHGEEVATQEAGAKLGSADYVRRRNLFCRQLLAVLEIVRPTRLASLNIENLYIDGGDDVITKSLLTILLCINRFPKLSSLTLKGNYIGDDGPEHLATLLHSNYPVESGCNVLPLKKLDMRNNYIGERGKYWLDNISVEYDVEILY